MRVYQTNPHGVFTGVTYADESPLEPGVWLIPAGCVEVPPPAFSDLQYAVWEAGAWAVKTTPVPEKPVPPTPAELLAAEREAMVISPMQGILTLGKTAWDKVLAYRATATWAEQIVIDSAQDWRRNSQSVAFFGYLLNFTDEQMDALFRAAATVTA